MESVKIMKKVEPSKILQDGYDTYVEVPVLYLDIKKDDVIVLSNLGVSDYKEFIVDDITCISNGNATLLIVEVKKKECDYCHGTGEIAYMDSGYLEEDNCHECGATGYVNI